MTNTSKRIGFVDNNLENFHSNVYLKLFRDELADRGYAVAGCTGLLEQEGREWAEKNAVPYFAGMDVLNDAVDFYIVLAPGDPEMHLELCGMTFPFGKTTYVDKTFAPDTATAVKIFDLADQHGVVMQTTSALRYTNAQDHVAGLAAGSVRHMVTWGGGRSFGEYAIHPLELAVSCMGPEVESVMRRGNENEAQILLGFSGERTAVVNVYVNASTPYAAMITTAEESTYVPVDTGAIFLNTAAAVLDMFDSGEANIDRAESLVIRKVLDAAESDEARAGFVSIV